MGRLSVTPGIGIAVENRLCRAGIRSCSRLADASPQEIREILGYLAQGSDMECWIVRAQEILRVHSL